MIARTSRVEVVNRRELDIVDITEINQIVVMIKSNDCLDAGTKQVDMSPPEVIYAGAISSATKSRPAHLFGKFTPFLSLISSSLLSSTFPRLSPPSSSSSFSAAPVALSTPTPASYPHTWPLHQPTTLLRTQRTRMPSPPSSFPIMPARSSVRVRTSSASQSSHSASQGVYSSVIGQSPGQSALPLKVGPTSTLIPFQQGYRHAQYVIQYLIWFPLTFPQFSLTRGSSSSPLESSFLASA